MTPSVRWTLVAVFAALTAGLLGYTVQKLREEARFLRGEVDFYRLEAASLQRDTETFYFEVTSDALVARVDAMVAMPDLTDRLRAAKSMVDDLTGLLVRFPDGGDVRGRILAVAEADNLQARQGFAEDFVAFTREIAGLGDALVEEAIIIEQQSAQTVSILVTAVSGIMSGFMTVVLYFQRSGRRVLEDEMLALEVEKMRIEVGRMRGSGGDVPERSEG